MASFQYNNQTVTFTGGDEILEIRINGVLVWTKYKNAHHQCIEEYIKADGESVLDGQVFEEVEYSGESYLLKDIANGDLILVDEQRLFSNFQPVEEF